MGCAWSHPPLTETNGQAEVNDKKQYSWYLLRSCFRKTDYICGRGRYTKAVQLGITFSYAQWELSTL